MHIPLQMEGFQRDVMNYIKPNHGTTTLGFVFKQGVIVACDSRASQGSYICESSAAPLEMLQNANNVFLLSKHSIGPALIIDCLSRAATLEIAVAFQAMAVILRLGLEGLFHHETCHQPVL